MGGCRCMFRDCTVSTHLYPGMHFFHFPISNRGRFERWLKLADKLDFLEAPYSFQRNRVLCARHFRMECFKNYKRDRLITKGTVEPTLMPLNEKYALDYANADQNAGPDLIEIPNVTMKHLIPPQGYEYQFTLHDNLNPMEYIQSRRIILGNITNYNDQLKTQSANPQNKRKLEAQSQNICSKKVKILNSTVSSTSPLEVSEVKSTQETVLQITIDDLESNEDLQNDMEDILLSPTLDNCNDDDSEHYNVMIQQQEDVMQMENRIDEGIMENDDILVQRQCQGVSVEYETEAHYVRQIEDMSVRIEKLEDDLQNAANKLKMKTNILLKYEGCVKKINNEYTKLEKKYKKLDKNFKDLMEENKSSSQEVQRLKEENDNILKKCEKYEKEKEQKQEKVVVCSQATSSITTGTCSVSRPECTAAVNSMQNPPSKAQLFNGVKKYISSSMAALLRMEMFGSAEREWKADEKRVSLDLLQLGDEVYKYIRDEWRFRLPGLGEVRNWLNDMGNSIDDEEHL